MKKRAPQLKRATTRTVAAGRRTKRTRKADTSALTAGPARTDSSTINRQWLTQYRALLALRDRLQAKRREQLSQAAEPLEPHSLSIADSATDEFDHDLTLAKLSSEGDALYEVEAALRRIRDGTYGRCEATGRPISIARLKAVPWTRFSREAEEQLEKQGVAKPPHLGKVASLQDANGGSVAEAESPGDEPRTVIAEDENLRMTDGSLDTPG